MHIGIFDFLTRQRMRAQVLAAVAADLIFLQFADADNLVVLLGSVRVNL